MLDYAIHDFSALCVFGDFGIYCTALCAFGDFGIYCTALCVFGAFGVDYRHKASVQYKVGGSPLGTWRPRRPWWRLGT